MLRLYDNLNRKKQSIEPDPDGAGPQLSPTTTFNYDAIGNATSLVDPLGNTTSWVHDTLGRTTSETDPLNKTRSWIYDAARRITSTTDRLSRKIENTYDNLDNKLTEIWKTGSTTNRTMTLTYDVLGNMLSSTDLTSTQSFTYDPLSRVTKRRSTMVRPLRISDCNIVLTRLVI